MSYDAESATGLDEAESVPTSEIEQTDRYIAYWNRQPDNPKTISILEKALSKIINWRPIGVSLFVRNRIGTSEGYYFENFFKEGSERLLENEKVASAFSNEAKTRLYKSIHYGSFLDHLFPVEARSYWRFNERTGKVFTVAALYLVLFMLLILPVAHFYAGLTAAESIYQTYDGPLKSLVRDEMFREKIQQVVSNSPKNFEKCQRATANSTVTVTKSLSWTVSYRLDCSTEILQNLPLFAALESNNTLWAASSSEDKARVLATVLLIEEILASETTGWKKHFSGPTFVTTPLVNYLELLTQAVIVFITIPIVNLYMTRKIVFYNILEKVSAQRRPALLKFTEFEVVNYLRDRRSYNFFISLIVTIILLVVHYYVVSYRDTFVNGPEAEVIGLRSYDYRLASFGQPVFIVHWALQFAIIFSLFRIGFDVRLLNERVCELQRELARTLKTIATGDQKAFAKPLDAIFGEVNQSHQFARTLLLLLPAVALALLCGFKFSNAGGLATIADLEFKSILFLIYIFSPFWLVVIFVLAAFRNPFGKMHDAIKSILKSKEETDWTQDALNNVSNALELAESIQKKIGFLARFKQIISNKTNAGEAT